MNKFLSWLFIFYFFVSSAVLVSIAALICLVTAPFDRNRRAVHTFGCAWGYHYFYLVQTWHTTYEGLENIDPKKTYVLVANHQSFVDILVLYGLFKPFKFVSKESIFKVPFIGWNMYLNQYVQVKRGNLKSIKVMMQICKHWLQQGNSIMIFPEGTRSPDGKLQEFRDGAFKLAMDTGLEVVPIIVDGTATIMPKGASSLDFNHREIRVRVLPPIDTKQFNGNSRKINDYVHASMLKNLDEMRHLPVQHETAKS